MYVVLCHNPEDLDLNLNRCGNHKSCIRSYTFTVLVVLGEEPKIILVNGLRVNTL
jgi:hypothetical protein